MTKNNVTAYLIVIQRVVHRNISLHGDGDRHENARRHHYHHPGEEQMREEKDVHGRHLKRNVRV